MHTSFSYQLMQFALSSLMIDKAARNDVLRLVERYAADSLAASLTTVYRPTMVEENRGLHRLSLNESEHPDPFKIRDDGGKYVRQVALAFDKGVPLWIVSAARGNILKRANEYRDLWSKERGLPSFRPRSSTNYNRRDRTRTSIIVPIRDQYRVAGVLRFDSDEYLHITEYAKEELIGIAEALGIIFRLYELSTIQLEETQQAASNVSVLFDSPLPRLVKPRIFLAYSARADKKVTRAMTDVLKSFDDKLTHIDWRNLREPGNITQQLLESMASCQAAVCYFSEPTQDGTYSDNVNVVFEAGMFQGRRIQRTNSPSCWLPIRERNSPILPFDFAHERILWVPRDDSGNLCQDLFAQILTSNINTILDTLGRPKRLDSV